MWPFTRNKKGIAIPEIRCGDIHIKWNADIGWWEFSAGGVDYSLCDNPVFDPVLLSKLHIVSKWLTDLEPQIDNEIKKHLEGWCDWTGEKQLIGIDVSWLIEKHEVDISYANDDWADLGVNLVITDGKISNSYAGD